MSDELVHLEVRGGVATITLDSPTNRNALSHRLVADLERQLAAALTDDDARVIVLGATGPVFCAGADLKEQRAANEAGESTATISGRAGGGLPGILSTIYHSPKPVVARVQGPARAGGIGLLAACDIAVGVEGATFGFSEVRLGVAPAVISVVLLPRIGAAKARELFLTAAPFDASEAVRIGLLNAAVPADRLDATVGDYVDALRQGAPTALAASKELIHKVPAMAMDEAFAWTSELSARLFASVDAREGMQAFAEKRPPRWAQREEPTR
ncbi:MAG: enoyl-CoA hydratase-related protein [Dehalococcoidia bacterium]|nr:enoyl-CoA hydratase-related protein [Dehalococcoidia bacterium]